MLAVCFFAIAARAQPTVFTYQGRLQSGGAPATGSYDLRFAIYDAVSGGSQVGITLTNASVGVTNGLFTTSLDFGTSPFNGNARWLEIGVRTNGSANPFTLLAPRQPLTATPYAIRAFNAQNLVGTLPAGSITGVLAVSNLPPTVAQLNTNAYFSGNVSAAQFSGNGSGLSNLSASTLTGTVADARLSPNVALVNTNVFFKATVVGSNFFGNGIGLTNVPGRIFEVIPTAANIQALANFGYLATNNLVPVVVTLPASANIRIGETVRVAGSGAGGWRIAQNAGQSVLMANLLDNSVGQNFTPRGSVLNWRSVAVSADGSKMVASANPGGIYTSADYGTTWTPQPGSPVAQCVASSGSGVNLVAGVNGGQLYLSTSSGVSWTPQGGSGFAWNSVASSLDGTKFIACATGAGGVVYTYAAGIWTLRFSATSFTAVASSADGARLLAAPPGMPLRVSQDSGVTWSNRGPSGVSWTAVTMSTDGSRMFAVGNGSPIYVSSDYGANWMSVIQSVPWTSIASSADGARLAAVFTTGGIFVSTDSGMTWSLRNLSSSTSWTSVGMSSDASTIAAGGTGSLIYVSAQNSTTPGVAGYLSGARLAAVELEYVGGGVFIPISYVGSIRAN